MNRIGSLRKKIQKIDGLLITNPYNVRYLTGFREGATLLITHKKVFFLTSFLYKEEAEKEIKEAEIIITKKDIFETLAKITKDIKRLGFEPTIKYFSYERMKKILKDKELIPCKEFVEKLRITKDENEIKDIKTAVNIGDKSFNEIKKYIRPGLKEKEIQVELDYILGKNESEKIPFPTIIASGPNSSLPHAKPGERRLKDGDLLILDFGAVYNGYCSDMTRTLFIGKPKSKAREIYKIVAEAQKKAIDSVKPGMKAKDVDKTARDIIKDKGYGKYFGHSLGHGVGLEVHEAPGVTAKMEKTIKPGMVFTIEPGIYIPDFGGVRIEDMVVVREDGCEVITRSEKLKI